MCMRQHQLLALAYGSLMALILAGTYVLDDSWMAYLLLVPAFLVFKAMGPSERSLHPKRAVRLPNVRRGVRIGLALAALTIPVALLMRALGVSDPIMSLVLIPVLLLASLVDREYFGWSAPGDRRRSSPTA